MHIRRGSGVAFGALALAIMAAGCGSTSQAGGTTNGGSASGGTTTTSNIGGGPISLPTTSTVPASRIPGCIRDCASVTTSDGMVYRIIDVRRFEDPYNQSIVSIGFSMTNTSSQTKTFEVDQGFNTVTSDLQQVDQQDWIGASSGDPRCYSDSTTDPSSSVSPVVYQVPPGATVVPSKEMCTLPPAGLTVIGAVFADDQADGNTLLRIPTPV